MGSTIHGAAKKTTLHLYRIWRAMRARCYTETCDMFHAYGALGVAICDEWRESPMEFVTWALSSGYADGLSIDRIDPTGNYAPSNCRWATAIEQGRNRRHNRMLTWDGQTRCMSEWADITGIHRANIQVRLDRCGWSIEKALTVIPKKRNRHIKAEATSC
jgi:hypothetical protein